MSSISHIYLHNLQGLSSGRTVHDDQTLTNCIKTINEDRENKEGKNTIIVTLQQRGGE